MGAGTVVNINRGREPVKPENAPQQAKVHRPAWLGFDIPLMLVVISLLVFGILMVYSASADFSFQVFGSATYVFQRQLMWLGVGTLAMVVLTFINYHRWSTWALWLMVGTLVLLIGVLLQQEERYGAVRSIFKGSIQPSELAKLAIVVYLSVWLYNRRSQIHEIRLWILPLATILGVLSVLILFQPDLSAVITIVLLGAMMIFLAGGGVKQLSIVMVLGLLVALILFRSGLFPTGPDRVASYLAGLNDPGSYSDHVRQALEAFIRGGWFGVGIGMSQTKLLGLPFPHTDSIFAVVGEELGVIGSAILVLLYVTLMWRGLTIARRAPDGLGTLLASGLSIWLITEASINMAVMVGLLPFAGNALPFISSGGSSLVVAMSAIGILLNVSRQAEKQKRVEERPSHAVIDLRGWDRRRRVSRPGRVAKPTAQD